MHWLPLLPPQCAKCFINHERACAQLGANLKGRDGRVLVLPEWGRGSLGTGFGVPGRRMKHRD